MSRTYRKFDSWTEYTLYHVCERRYFVENGKFTDRGYWGWFEHTPTKKELALARKDRNGIGKKGYFKEISEVRRNNDRRQFYKLSRLEDYEDFDFDDSKHIMKKKGIWWEIY